MKWPTSRCGLCWYSTSTSWGVLIWSPCRRSRRVTHTTAAAKNKGLINAGWIPSLGHQGGRPGPGAEDQPVGYLRKPAVCRLGTGGLWMERNAEKAYLPATLAVPNYTTYAFAFGSQNNSSWFQGQHLATLCRTKGICVLDRGAQAVLSG